MTLKASLCCLLLALAPAGACRAQPAQGPLMLERTIRLSEVGGRIDHLAMDLKRGRLFVAELGSGSVEAIDVPTGRSVWRIGGLKEPQGLAFLPDQDELAVASGGDGTIRFFAGAQLTAAGQIVVGDDADNLRVDPITGYLVVGYGSGALAIIDPAKRTVVATFALPAHPESFRLSGGKAWINTPDARRIVLADLASGRTLASWPTDALWNFPMALDADAGLLAVVFRLPARLELLDAASGQVRQRLETCSDSDDVFFDDKRRALYVICGGGAVDVFKMADGVWSRQGRVATRSGARTGLFVRELDRLFVAARAGPGGEAAILVLRSAS